MNWSGNHPRTLEGIRVLDFTRLLPGPFSTMLLADLGAEVTKIEAPEGGDYARWYPPMFGEGAEAMSALFASVNRGKRSVSINLKHAPGAEIARKLAASVDVVVETFRPGVMDRLGLGPAQLREANPGLIYCGITGFGQTGPYRDAAGHDLTYLAMGGALEQTAPLGGAPHPPGFQLADLMGGGMYATMAILAALYHRERSGEGAELDISMTDGAATTMAPLFGRLAAGGDLPTRGGAELTGGIPCYRVYECSDGKFMAIGALEPKFWNGFCAAVAKPEWVSKAYNSDPTYIAEVETLFQTRTRDEWAGLFADKDICCEPVLDVAEVMQSDLMKARELFFELGGVGRVATLQTATPITPSLSRQALQPPPFQGEHTRETLCSLGLADGDIEALVASKTVKVHQ